MTRDKAIAECKRQAAGGASIEAVLEFLREAGCSKIDSIAIVIAAFDVGPAKAKEIVHLSGTWSDVRASHDAFHDALIDALGGAAPSEAP